MTTPTRIHPDDLTPAQKGTAVHHLLEICLRYNAAPHEYVGKVVTCEWGGEEEHAKLSPSGAHRWLSCPGMILGLADLPKTKQPKCETNITTEMANCAELAVDYCAPLLRKAKHKGIEDKVSIPATGEFGTVDVWALVDDTLYVVDYKNGRHDVKAKANPQLMLYTEGVMLRVLKKVAVAPKKVILVIIGPNMPGEPVRVWDCGYQAITSWITRTVAPVVAVINDGTACRVAGDHCRGCKLEGSCTTAAKHGAALARMEWKDFIDPKAAAPTKPLTAGEIAAVVTRLKFLRSFADAVEKEAMRRLAANPKAIPGLKVVEGQSRRRWKDPDAVVAVLRKHKFNADDFAPRKLAGLTDVLRLLPAAKREAFAARWSMKPHGKPTLAPSNDERPSIHHDAAADFADDIDDTL